MYGGEEKFVQGLGGENLKERVTLEELGVVGRMKLKMTLNRAR